MFNRLLLFVFLCNLHLLNAQWGEHLIIDNDIYSTQKLILADLDNDGKKDIIYFRSHDRVYWLKKIDAAGNFGPPNLIVQNQFNLRGLAVGDLTGNGFKDVVISVPDVTNPGNSLRWMEHLDGNGTFSSPHLIPENPNTLAQSIILADMDTDGMLDIVVSATPSSDGGINWYRNLGNGIFSAGNVVVTNFSNGTGIAVGDIDGDNDLDIVSGTSNTGVMSWFENLDGQGTFGEPRPIGSSGNPGFNVQRLHLVDIDGDGDLDVVGSSGLTQAFAWWENLDGLGNFSLENFIELENLITGVYPADIDNDGDIDLFTLSPGFMRWYENLDGLGSYGEAILITDSLPSAVTIEATDINSDGWVDAVTASQINRTILWYENSLLSINDLSKQPFFIYPNPVDDTLNFNVKEPPTLVKIFTLLGQPIQHEWRQGSNEIDISGLLPGMYLIELVFSNKTIERYKFIKK